MAVILFLGAGVDLTAHRVGAADDAFEPRVAHARCNCDVGQRTRAVAVGRTCQTQRWVSTGHTLVSVGRALADVGSRAVIACSSGTALQCSRSRLALTVIRAGCA